MSGPEFGGHQRAEKAPPIHGLDQFARKTTHQGLLAICHRAEGRDQSRRPHSSETTRGLYQQDFRTQASRTDSRGSARGTAASDEYIIAFFHGHFASEPICFQWSLPAGPLLIPSHEAYSKLVVNLHHHDYV